MNSIKELETAKLALINLQYRNRIATIIVLATSVFGITFGFLLSL